MRHQLDGLKNRRSRGCLEASSRWLMGWSQGPVPQLSQILAAAALAAALSAAGGVDRTAPTPTGGGAVPAGLAQLSRSFKPAERARGSLEKYFQNLDPTRLGCGRQVAAGFISAAAIVGSGPISLGLSSPSLSPTNMPTPGSSVT